MATTPVTAAPIPLCPTGEEAAGIAQAPGGRAARGGSLARPGAPAAATSAAATKKVGGAATAPAAKAGSSRSAALQRRPRATAPSPWQPQADARPAPGYAPAASAGTSRGGDWAFLHDASLSIEEKLARFAAQAMKNVDKELEAKMARYKADFAGSSSSGGGGSQGAKKGGLSLFDGLKALIPGVGVAEGLLGEAAFKKIASSLGGPALAAAATALGMPQLAPLAMKYGGDVAGLAFADLGGSSGSSSSGSGSTPAKKEAGSPDEKMAMLEIQLLVEKQQRMFTAISNTLKILHDTQMAAVHNVR